MLFGKKKKKEFLFPEITEDNKKYKTVVLRNRDGFRLLIQTDFWLSL